MKREIQKPKYPFIAFRPSSHLQENRIRNLAKTTGLSISEVLQECISSHLHILESHAGIAAPPRPRAALVGPEGEGLVTLPPRRSPKGGRA